MPRLRPVSLLPDPWMALDLSTADPEMPIVTVGGPRELARFRGVRPLLLPGDGDTSTASLLKDPRVRAMLRRPSWLVASSTSAGLERAAQAVRSRPAFAPAAVVRALQNRRRLAELATLAKVKTAPQRPGVLRPTADFGSLAADLGDDLVIQGPRGTGLSGVFRVRSEAQWQQARSALQGKPVRVARFVEGRPATVLAVLDTGGRGVLSPVLATLRGEESMTSRALGTCGDDFTWRGDGPGEAPLEMVERMGRYLGKSGFRGAARFDFIIPADGEPVLVGFDPRLDASFCALCAAKPDVLKLLFRAIEGDSLPSRRLAPMHVALATVYDTDGTGKPLDEAPDGTQMRPVPWADVDPGRLRGRWRTRGALVNAAGLRAG